MRIPVALFLLLAHLSFAQLISLLPQNARTDIYFPHITDGGPAANQWQTRFTFMNPNASAVVVTLNLYSNAGNPLLLDLGTGNGAASTVSFSVAANGTFALLSTISPVKIEGWGYASATLPIQANVAFRFIQNGVAKVEVTAPPSLPSGAYRSVATAQMGVAVANVYDAPKSYLVTAYGAAGNLVGQGSLTLPAAGHSSFNLNQFLPNLPSDYSGSLLVTPQVPGDYLIAWALYADASGMISSLPDGRIDFPPAHTALIDESFARLVNAYQGMLSDFGPAPQLVKSEDTSAQSINAYASSGTTVQINYALSELLNGSPNELAFVIGHELGHIYQQRTGKFHWYMDAEWDADSWSVLAELNAGYDPYSSSGALGKLMMATASGGPLMPNWEQMVGTDAHNSFPARIDNLTTFIQSICGSSSSLQNFCQTYKSQAHPHFPAFSFTTLATPKPPAKAMPGVNK